MTHQDVGKFPHKGSIFDVAKVEDEVRKEQPDLRILWMDTTTSTNDEARELARLHAASWTMIVAGQQTAGRGRYTRIWKSPPGGLYFSVLLHIENPSSPITLIPLLAGLAVKDGIESELARLGGGAFHGYLKWPNDLLTKRGKLGGILCEASADDGVWEIIIGAGVNFDPIELDDVPADQAQAVTSLRNDYPAVAWTREDLLIAIVTRLNDWLNTWKKKTSAIREAWLEASGVVGKEVTATSMGEKITGTATGLGKNGELLIRTDVGVYPLNAAEAVIVHDEWRT